MPVGFWNSSVLRWLDQREVVSALCRWARQAAARRSEILLSATAASTVGEIGEWEATGMW